MITQSINPGRIIKNKTVFYLKKFSKFFFVVVVGDVVVVDVVVVVLLLLLSLGIRSALVTRTGSDSYRLRFSTQVLKLSSGELGKIAVVAAVAGIVRTKTLRDQQIDCLPEL